MSPFYEALKDRNVPLELNHDHRTTGHITLSFIEDDLCNIAMHNNKSAVFEHSQSMGNYTRYWVCRVKDPSIFLGIVTETTTAEDIWARVEAMLQLSPLGVVVLKPPTHKVTLAIGLKTAAEMLREASDGFGRK